ncbi:MAG TPA: VWA domain-containing protein [Spongiibacteraceae bacterium]|nr:VWA domain-containing protein [Spongiibacteraceae bacterium]
MLGFDYPWAALLAPLPLLIYFLWPRAQQQQAALRVPFYAQLAANETLLPRHVRSRVRLFSLLLWWLLLIAAACGPHWLGDAVSLPASGRDLMLAVDLSGSMQIEDMQIRDEPVQRLIAVKTVVDDFLQHRRGDRVGLIVFGTRAYVQAPLTFDLDTVGRFLREAQIGFAGEETAIGDALGLAVKRLRDRPGDRHVLILLTDGANTAGNVTPAAAAKLAADNHIVIYTVGIGADSMIIPGPFGTNFGARRVNPSQDLDEDALKNIADTTGGRYFRARNPQELAGIYRLLDSLEPVVDNTQTYRPQSTLFFWPLGAAFLSSLVFASAALPWRANLRAANNAAPINNPAPQK